jgi:hypothetical protein
VEISLILAAWAVPDNSGRAGASAATRMKTLKNLNSSTDIFVRMARILISFLVFYAANADLFLCGGFVPHALSAFDLRRSLRRLTLIQVSPAPAGRAATLRAFAARAISK